MSGRSILGAPAGEDRLPRLEAYARQARVGRHAFVPGMILWGGLGVAAAAVSIAALFLARAWLVPLARAGLCFVATVPTVMLLVGGFRFVDVPTLLGTIGLGSLALTGVFALLGRTSSPLLLSFGTASLTILIEQLSGGSRMPLALLGELPVQGFRFYGIGNEYTGVLLGTALPLIPWIWQIGGHDRLSRAGWILAIAWWVAVVVVLAWPGLGADFGGGLAALIGALATARLSAVGRLRPLDILCFAVSALLLGAAVFLVDWSRGPEFQTHIGLLSRHLDAETLLAVIERKVAMNVRNLTAGPLAASVIVVAPVLMLWYYGAGHRTRDALKRRPLLAGGLGGTLVGAAAAFVLNDSGSVPWGIATSAVLACLLDTLLSERGTQGKVEHRT